MSSNNIYQALNMSLANIHYLILILIIVLYVFFHVIYGRYYSSPILQVKKLMTENSNNLIKVTQPVCDGNGLDPKLSDLKFTGGTHCIAYQSSEGSGPSSAVN